jgi:hypothetical protein
MGARPHTPGFFASLPSQSTIPVKAERGEHVAPFGLAPWSALELRPRIALPSAKVSNSVADDYQEARSYRERAAEMTITLR